MNILPKKLINKFILNEQKLRSAQWREINGCPKSVDASYSGYTGIKIYKFPTSDSFPSFSYPEISNDFDAFKREIISEVNAKRRERFGKIKVLKLFLDNFATGEKWDTKFKIEFPGRDKNGRVQFAKYNSNIVTGNYLSNNIYGFLCAKIGIPESISKFIARFYSKGLLEPLITGKFPDKNLLQFSDPLSDQKAISSGYKDYKNWVKAMQ